MLGYQVYKRLSLDNSVKSICFAIEQSSRALTGQGNTRTVLGATFQSISQHS